MDNMYNTLQKHNFVKNLINMVQWNSNALKLGSTFLDGGLLEDVFDGTFMKAGIDPYFRLYIGSSPPSVRQRMLSGEAIYRGLHQFLHESPVPSKEEAMYAYARRYLANEVKRSLLEQNIEVSLGNRQAIDELLDTLMPREKQVLQYRFFEGLGYKKIAKTMNCQSGRVRQIEHKALRKLRHYRRFKKIDYHVRQNVLRLSMPDPATLEYLSQLEELNKGDPAPKFQ